MTIDRAQLWARVARFEVDDGSVELSFLDRLARENGWGREFTGRVFDEYLRFMYLTVAAGHPVTPSDDVDQAWHLHLTYSRSYWLDFCPNVLGEPIHHGPTVGGMDEGKKYWSWYEATLDSYREHFGVEPPSDIWPSPQRRFADVSRFRRVNTARRWLVPKPPRFATRIGVLAVVALLATALLSGTAARTAGALGGAGVLANSDDSSGAVWFWIVVAVVALGVFVWRRRCGACGTFWSLKAGLEIDGKVEWKCRSCGQTVMRKKSSGGGGGGGCGGCGGCGG